MKEYKIVLKDFHRKTFDILKELTLMNELHKRQLWNMYLKEVDRQCYNFSSRRWLYDSHSTPTGIYLNKPLLQGA